MQILRIQEVIKLLREEVQRAGSQSEFARQKGVQPSLVNRVLRGDRFPPLRLCRALGLEWVLVSQVEVGGMELDIITWRDFRRILREEINKAGSITGWARQFRIDRAHLSSVLHRRRAPDQRIIAALNLSEVLVYANDPRLPRSRQQHTRTRHGQPHARWKKKPRISMRGSSSHEA